jgi:hypothetical protein
MSRLNAIPTDLVATTFLEKLPSDEWQEFSHGLAGVHSAAINGHFAPAFRGDENRHFVLDSY